MRYKLGQNDLDWRGLRKTADQAIEEAFKRTGKPRSDFTVNKWGRDKNGKSQPVEWRHKDGVEVNMDWPHVNDGPDAPHVGWQTGGKRSGGGAQRGHIILDEVPAKSGTLYGPNCGRIFGRIETVENQTSFLCAGRIVANFGANLYDIVGRIDFRGTRAGWCQLADTFDPLSSQQNGPTDPQLAKAIACDDSIEPPGLRRHPVDSNQTARKTLSHSVDLFFSCSWRVANIRG